ncbi:hypothetical protein [uncultured Oscillibacter sp.]|uniref:hypothetical protein n=1 Tax=uncultured Oscillibacter sp. TaxID=876091 RepID=UPI0025F07588|nr:hypothetical protein [uncultured Oscillibacter sp.]
MIINNSGADVKVAFSTDEIEKSGCGFVQLDENTRAYFISINVWELMQKNRSVRKLLNTMLCEELSISESETGSFVKNNNFGSSINIIDRNGSREYSFKLGGVLKESEKITKSFSCKLSTYETMIINDYIKNINACIENGNYEKAPNVISI